MKKSDLFKQQRSQKLDAQAAILDKCKAENREMNAEEVLSFDALDVESTALEGQISRALKAEKIALEIASRAAGAVPTGDGGEGKEKRKMELAYSITRHIRMAREGKDLDGIEKEIHDIGISESRAAGVKIDENATVHIPMSVLRGTGQSVSEDAGAYGGFLVTDQAPRVQASFTPKLFLEALGATRLSGLQGGDVPLPVAGAATFQWLGETEEIADQKVAINGPVLSPKRLGAAIPISNRLLLQTSIDVQTMVLNILRNGYENTLQLAAINGSGTGNTPRGILNTVGIFSAAHAAAPATRAMLLALQAAVENADSTEQALGFLMHPSVKYALMGTPIDAGSGRFLLENNTINGERTVSSSIVPSLAGQRPLIYGDFSQLFIGEWGSLSLVVNPWSKLKSGQLEMVANAYADIAIAQPGAFAVDKFITT
jgi:HK97 family phage major capsid protein